jgi:hypothetical protein
LKLQTAQRVEIALQQKVSIAETTDTLIRVRAARIYDLTGCATVGVDAAALKTETIRSLFDLTAEGVGLARDELTIVITERLVGSSFLGASTRIAHASRAGLTVHILPIVTCNFEIIPESLSVQGTLEVRVITSTDPVPKLAVDLEIALRCWVSQRHRITWLAGLALE